MMEPRVSVVILNYNTRQYLEQLLPSVLATDWPNLEVVVADNCSKDGSADFVATHFPQVRLIRFDENHGYTGGYNKALNTIAADYYVLLNSDVEVPADWLRPLVALAEANPALAAAQPMIMDFNHRQRFEYAGAAGGYIDRYGYPFCRGRLFDVLEENHGQYPTEPVFWASGAAFFVRARDYHAAGGLDTRFFAHMEEIDLCWRLQSMGKHVYAVAESRVYHIGGGTLNKQSAFKTYLNFRNGLLLLEKNLPQRGKVKTIFIRMILDGIAAFRFILMGQWHSFLAIIRAHIYFHRNRRKFRPETRGQAPHANLAGYFHGSLVLQFFLRKRRKFTELK
jgi:GT2 family glycosyltransferase